MYTTDKECVMQDKDIVIYHLSPRQMPAFLLGFSKENYPLLININWRHKGKLDYKSIESFKEEIRNDFGDVEFLTIAAECKEHNVWGITATGIRRKSANITEPYPFIGLFRNAP
jgi:hypothetical protein